MKIITPVFRDKKAIELNELLNEFIGKLEIICVGYDEQIMDITLIESERREKEFNELMQNPEEFHKLIDLIDEKTMIEEILSELKDIVYIDYEETNLSTSQSFLTSKTTPRLRKQSDFADRLAKHVRPHIISGETRRNEIAKIEGFAPQTIINSVQQVYGEETDWKTYVRKVRDGDW